MSSLMAGVMITAIPQAGNAAPDDISDKGRDAALRVLTADGPARKASGGIYASALNDPAKNIRVAWVRTRPDGTLVFPDVPVSRLRDYANGGQVNLELAVSSGRFFGDHNYTLTLPDSGTVSLRPKMISRETQSVSGGGSQISESTATDFMDSEGNLRLEPWRSKLAAKVPCAEGEIANSRFGVNTALVVARSDTKGITVQYRYLSGQSSTVGIAVSPTGAFGTFSKSGTRSIKNDSEVKFGAVENSSKLLMTVVGYAKFRDFLYTDKGGQGICRVLSKPVFVAGGNITTPAGGFSASNCVPYKKGGGWTTSRQVATEWIDGVQAAAALGLSLSSQTGYSTTGSLEFNYSKAGQLCGQYAFPGDTTTYVGSYIAR